MRCRSTSSTTRKTLLSPADMTRHSEHNMRVTDVLCFSAVTIKSLVHEWLDAEGLDDRPGEWWVKQLLREPQEARQVRERAPLP